MPKRRVRSSLGSNEQGQAVIEYALLTVGVGLALAILLNDFGGGLIQRASDFVAGAV